MKIVPLSLKEANEFVLAYHRHHKPVQGHKFSIGVLDNNSNLVGAAIVGRPVARMVDASKVLEVTRLVTDGSKNACSMLYSAAARVARELGYEKIQTYILEDEPGISLMASGWKFETNTTEKHSWNNRAGRRLDQPNGIKQRWAKVFTEVK